MTRINIQNRYTYFMLKTNTVSHTPAGSKYKHGNLQMKPEIKSKSCLRPAPSTKNLDMSGRNFFMLYCTSSLLSAIVGVVIIMTLLISATSATAQKAIVGDTIYTMEGDPIVNGVVLIRDGKIERVGSVAEITIPADYEKFQGSVVTPGLIDARSVVGLAGYYNQDHDQDQLEYSHALQPDLRAIDAYNSREELVGFLLKNGITTVHTGHAPGAVISGQTMIVKTTGRTVDEALVDSTTALAITLGSVVRSNFDTPGTRSKGVSMLRQELIRAVEYAEKRSNADPERRPERDLRLEALADMLDGRLFALITAQRSQDIMTALRLQQEFGFPLIIDGAAEAYLLLDEIADAGVPVIIHPTMVRTRGDTENAAFDTSQKLSEAGIPFAFQSSYETYVPKTRIALFEAAVAVGYGLDRMTALRALTIETASLFGLDNRIGSLQNGKEADIVIFNGDPFEYTSRPTHVFINGRLLHEAN